MQIFINSLLFKLRQFAVVVARGRPAPGDADAMR